MGHKQTDNRKWFKENYPWLKKWLKNPRQQADWRNLQHFVTDGEYWAMNKTRKGEIEILKDIEKLHKKEILLTAVFGVLREAKEPIHFNPYSMSGFVERFGRYPTKKDKAFFVCEDWFKLHKFVNSWNNYQYHTRCRLEVENGT